MVRDVSKMRISLFLSFTLALVALPGFAARSALSVLDGTVEKIDAGAKTIVVKTADGAEHTFHFLDRTAVHGGKAMAAAGKETLHGLNEGTHVAVHYTTRGAVDTADEIDHLGQDGLKTSEGTIKQIDRGAKTMTISAADGTEQTFRLTGRAAADTAKDIGKDTGKAAKVTVYYTEDAGKKVVHFFKEGA